jgi:hypothetical protein
VLALERMSLLRSIQEVRRGGVVSDVDHAVESTDLDEASNQWRRVEQDDASTFAEQANSVEDHVVPVESM